MNEMLGNYRVVDLTKKLYPEKETRRLEIRRFLVEMTTTVAYHSEMDLMSHLGTHVEAPYHQQDDWPDVLQLPTTAFMRRGVVLYLGEIQPCAIISVEDLEQADRGRLRAGDVVILTSPYHSEPFSLRANDQRPHIGTESARWLADKNVKAVGLGDSVAIGDSVTVKNAELESFAFHDILMAQNVTFIEVMENLDELRDDIFLIIFLPLPIAGLDSCPVRVVALEGVPGFSPAG